MTLRIALLLLAGVLLAPAAALAQEAAGRVILATGNVTIVRGAQKLPATVGIPLRSGDTVDVGAQSHAQILLTDDSIISLRPETTFRIREYAFAAKDPSAGRAFFDLVKGGMRTVTGLIQRRENYNVTTPSATIGIRGTHYWLVSCNQDCRNRDGSLAPDGDYGLVREGTVAVEAKIKQAEKVFGTDQIMHVQGAPGMQREFVSDQVFSIERGTGQITQQIGPPPFLFTPIGGFTPSKPSVTPPAPRTDTAPTLALTGPQGQTTGDTRVTFSGTDNTNFTFFNVKQVSSTTPASAASDPVFQAAAPLSTEGPAAVLPLTFTGTTFYRLAGSALNIPVSCSDGPCSAATAGEITLGVNFTLQRAQVNVALKFADGGIINVGTPSTLSGVPITVSGNQVTFSGTLNRVDFPENNGAFRCSDCGPGGTPGFFDQLTFSGTISGNQATLVLGASDAAGSGGLTATLPLATPPNNHAAAMVVQRLDGGTDTRSAAFWGVELDASRRLVKFGPNDGVNSFGNRIGGPSATVGSAINAIAGTAPAAGNLVWGTWTGPGAMLTDGVYDSYTSTASGRLSVQPWVTGEAPNTLPPSLGTLTYTPVGAVFTNANQQLLGASLTADFLNRRLTIDIRARNNSVGTPGLSNTYQMLGASGFSPSQNRFSSGFHTVTCSGPCNNGSGTPDGSFAGFFAGQQAQGAGVVFSAGFGGGVGAAGNGVTGAMGMKR